MVRKILFLLFVAVLAAAQQASDPVAEAIADGNTYLESGDLDKALNAFKKADRAAHHNSPKAYIGIASVERRNGDFSAALEDAKRAYKAAGDDQHDAIAGHLLRAVILTQMSGKPTDKKLKEAEEEIRQALALDPNEPVVHFNLGMVLVKQERDPEGLAELKTFVAAPGTDPKSVAEAQRVIANPIRAREPFAPDFSFTTEEKEDISNASLRGHVVLLDFWGTWCGPCRESVPMVRELQHRYSGKDVRIIGISSDEDEDAWRNFIREQHMTWSEYIDLSSQVIPAFDVDSYPTYVVLDRDGVIRYRQSGVGDDTEGDIADAINKALKRASDPALAAAAAAPAPPAPEPKPVLHSAGSAGAASPAVAMSGSELENGSVSGGVYHNPALGLTFDLPKNWVAARPEMLLQANQKQEAAAKAALLQQHPELGTVRISIPKTVLYASRRGDGDGMRMSVPSLRITAVESRMNNTDLDRFKQVSELRAQATSMRVTQPAFLFEVNGHNFMRADFEQDAGSGHKMQYAYIQTLSGDYLLTIEIFAGSRQELQDATAALQSMKFAEE